MGGHGTTLGGIVVDSGNFPWARYPERYPMFCKPDASYHGLVYTERFGRAAYIARCRSVFLRTLGAALAPMSTFLLLQGIETVAIRVERHVQNAAKVAAFLQSDPRVEWVNYAGFETNPYHGFVQTYLGGSACSLMTFGVEGGYASGMRFYNALNLIKRVVNLGDVKSLACHPASTTHRQMPVKDQLKAGVTPSTIRLSIGIEHIDDILADIDQSLTAATGQPRGPERDMARTNQPLQVPA
jgi:O-acetylhomoserine (thiol)-lyase